MTVLCGVPLALLGWGAMAWDEIGEAKPVDCADAMEFARGSLPAGVQGPVCRAAYWQDTQVTVEFRMERAGYEPWLDAVYPTRKPALTCDHGLAACSEVSFDETLFVDVGVAYEYGDTILVRLKAFDL
ncbi:hypothetical protein Q5762_22710 [Streptomyces sp. P9(2023)]|uniref:hypothetical protein n=1 Tax=Streptomyces sp. P9(2023) TaxID=3064394 RepID=UPI0028F421B9|nr:hypothetical protein [Streptomyces sp. P9(2023)]MDT9691108.1 hypothetical protein [Streptomyces sp. P9(2023)]